MVAARAQRLARRLALLASIASFSTTLWLTAAGPMLACSCVQPQPMAAYGTAEHAIFSGTAGPSDARGVPVRVTTWFSGPGAAPIVYLAAQSFGDGASCGTTVPSAGSASIWVTFLPKDGGDPVTSLCSPHGILGTPEGDALLADATAAFGGGAPPETIATNPPEAAPQAQIVPAESGAPILLATVGLGIAVLLGTVAFAHRRTRPGV
jgi:hypothetical protein